MRDEKNAGKRSTERAAERIESGQYIVADPKVCHGKVTFKGARIFVSDVLDDLENGLSWDFIIRRWGGGKLTKAAIAEALHLSRSTWLDERGRQVPPSFGFAFAQRRVNVTERNSVFARAGGF